MGNSGVRRANEDILCAEYIKSLVLEQTIAETLYEDDYLEVFHRTGNEEPSTLTIHALADELKSNGGEHFFDHERQHIYPKADFVMSTRCDVLDLVIRVTRDEEGRLVAEQINL
jgi:2-phosphosulfolactate phosphatase